MQMALGRVAHGVSEMRLKAGHHIGMWARAGSSASLTMVVAAKAAWCRLRESAATNGNIPCAVFPGLGPAR